MPLEIKNGVQELWPLDKGKVIYDTINKNAAILRDLIVNNFGYSQSYILPLVDRNWNANNLNSTGMYEQNIVLPQVSGDKPDLGQIDLTQMTISFYEFVKNKLGKRVYLTCEYLVDNSVKKLKIFTNQKIHYVMILVQ